MLIAGANFVLLYRGFVRRRPGSLARDEEFRLYVALVLARGRRCSRCRSGATGSREGEEAIRAGVFQAVSIITTTGYGERGLRPVAARLSAERSSR